MSNIRVMFIAQGAGGAAEDRIVNVFHFVGSSSYAIDAPAAAESVESFYTTLNTAMSQTQTNAIGGYLSPWLSRDAELRTYDMTTPKIRVPTISPIVLPAALSNGGLPEEVALCLSYKAPAPVGPRRRGRLYIGPFVGSTDTEATDTTPSRPGQVIVDDLAIAAAWLMSTTSVGITWSIRSTTPTENYVTITGGWVDNAWDTQRRRGPDPSARTFWGDTVPV